MPTSARRLRYFTVLTLVLLAIVATRYQELDLPLLRFLRGDNRIDPLTLHLAGEFTEGNLGLEQDADGSVTLRMIAQQYLFIPHCIVLPANVPVHLRITSADAVHTLLFSGTNYAVKAVPGAVTQASLEFTRPGEYQMPCGEFCGAGHYGMRSRLLVVPREQFSLADTSLGETVSRANPVGRLLQFRRGPFLSLVVILALPLAVAGYAMLQQFRSDAQNHIPSNVAWTDETIKGVSNGNALQGLLLAKRCEHCHGSEGFSASAATPNLAGMDKLVTWKQMQDFLAHKRTSRVMEPIAASLSQRDIADLAVYYSVLPAYADPQDNRSFPQSSPEFSHSSVAARLIVAGDGSRGIPPCQACHGPVAYHPGAPSLTVQNNDYLFDQLEAFASGARANDINLPMRTIASQLTVDERRALADYYGSGLGLLPAGATVPQ